MFLSDFCMDSHEITEEEFQALIIDAYSHVGNEDIAAAIGVAYNFEPVHCRPGDLLLYARKSRGVLKFHCIMVLPPQRELIREYEEQEEEAIEWL